MSGESGGGVGGLAGASGEPGPAAGGPDRAASEGDPAAGEPGGGLARAAGGPGPAAGGSAWAAGEPGREGGGLARAAGESDLAVGESGLTTPVPYDPAGEEPADVGPGGGSGGQQDAAGSPPAGIPAGGYPGTERDLPERFEPLHSELLPGLDPGPGTGPAEPPGPAGPDPVTYGPESYGAPTSYAPAGDGGPATDDLRDPYLYGPSYYPPDPYGAAEPYEADDPYDPADPYGSTDLYGPAEPGHETGPDDAAEPGREALPAQEAGLGRGPGRGAGPYLPREAPSARSVFRAPAAVQHDFPPASVREPKPPPEAPTAARVAEPAPPPAGPPPAGTDSLTPEFLLPARRRAPAPGWRRILYQASGGLIRVSASAAEQRRQDMMARVRTPVAGGHHRVAVLSLKGGVGKTTTTVGLGATLASLRGDRVIAVDANPDRGTLSDKVHLETAATVRDLLNERGQIERYADVRAFTSQSSSRLEVLASDRDPTVSVAFSENDYCEVARVLEHYYSICITDCGTGLLHSAMAGVLRLADQIVLVSSPSVDGARSASATLDWLAAHAYGDLVQNAVVVLSVIRPGSRSTVDLDRLEQHFAARCRAVTRIPFDSHLEEGAELELDQLSRGTADAYLALAALVGDGLATSRRAELSPGPA
ncbi:MAG TPA: MinD/ParA family protein [Streptosporangiaceae bacterium]